MTISRTGADTRPLYLKCMLTGPPKSGKTSFLGTVPNIVVADTEPHANNMESLAHLGVLHKTINSTVDLRDLHMILSNESLRKQQAQALGIDDITAVAIDTLDTLQALMKKERLKETRAASFLRDDWGWLKVEMENMLQAFLALPMHVFFVVHTKTKDIGTEKNPKSVVLPGLEGAIAESIAGMVGYSLLSFRKQELRPDGTSYTKYWLRAEGDETYEFLGNRAAGRLPDVIEPDFQHLLDAAMKGRVTVQTPVANPNPTPIQPVAAAPAAAPAPAAPEAAPEAQAPAPEAAPAPAPKEEVAPTSGQGTPTLPADDEPINATALVHVKKVYDALQIAFPEERLKQETLGSARNIVRMWNGVRADHEQGKGSAESPEAEMKEYLQSMGFLAPEGTPVEQPKGEVEPKLDGTIEQVLAYVGGDLAKVQEAYDAEVGKDKPRSSLVDKLLSLGAKEIQTDGEKSEAAPEAPAEAVTPDQPVADDSHVEAVQAVQDGLGGQVISDEIKPDAPCEACGKQIDDVDLAQLGKTRFSKVLCVADYIAMTKTPANV